MHLFVLAEVMLCIRLGLQVLEKWEYQRECPDPATVRVIISLHELLHRIRRLGSAPTETQLLQWTDKAVTTCRLPQSHRGARSYPNDPAYPSTTLVYEVTTLASPGLPPFGWTSKTLVQARKHNEPLSVPGSSGQTKSVAQLMNELSMD